MIEEGGLANYKAELRQTMSFMNNYENVEIL